MMKTKMVLWAVVAALVVLGAGWLWGAGGRWAIEGQARATMLRLQLAEGRAALTAARIDVFELNFGNASRHIEQGKRALTAAAGQLDQDGPAESATAVRDALAKAADAQQLAGSVDQAANSRLADAVKALDRAASANR